MNDIEISRHSELRLLSRVDPSEEYPKERIKTMLAEGEKVDRPDIRGQAIRAGRALIVLRERTVATILRRTGE